MNGFIIADLIHLKAVESAATIKAAFYARRVDLTITGNWKMVKEDLGLDPSAEIPGPEPEDEPIPSLFDSLAGRSSDFDPGQYLPPLPGLLSPSPAKRFKNKAAKAKRKQEKKSRKLNRKRK